MTTRRRAALPPVQHFSHGGRRIAYREYGAGPRTLVFTHGLLMDGRMFVKLAPVVAAHGHRIVIVDMLGHGESDQPHDMTAYSMTAFGRDVIALLDHLELPQAVIGGTSLGANVALEAAVFAPTRVRALVVEMPVLEHALAAVALVFVPLALSIRLNRPGMRLLSALARRIPRSLFLADTVLDFVRRDPDASLAVLDGITFGRVAPPGQQRRALLHPTLVIGHASDPIHPFGDADVLAREMPNARLLRARSIAEWRLRPARLDAELCAFLDEVWAEQRPRLASVGG
jgi:pimeloyl-ACP methyl ester carboxylesterase